MMFINGTGAVFPSPIPEAGKGFLAGGSKYDQYIPPAQLRRMSHIIRMGMGAAKAALADADLLNPDAILTATALGANEDTEKFLRSFLASGGTGSPTSFIQSTHNAVGGQVALSIPSYVYNMTYTQRGFSFESAIKDCELLLSEGLLNVLCGAFDEITPLVSKVAEWKNDTVPPGEGAAFFVMSSGPAASTRAVFHKQILELNDEIVFRRRSLEAIRQLGISAENSIVFSDTTPDFLQGYKKESIFERTGNFYTRSALALQIAIDALADNPSINFGIVCCSDNNRYHRMFIIERYKL